MAEITGAGGSHPADQAENTHDQEEPSRARGTPLTRRDSRAARHGPALKNSRQPLPQASTPPSRKIEARPSTCAAHCQRGFGTHGQYASIPVRPN